MSAGGHMMDMVQRMKQNRLLRLARRERTQKVLNSHRTSLHYDDETSSSKKLSAAELEAFATKVKQQKEMERALVRSKTIKTILLILLGLFILFGIASEY